MVQLSRTVKKVSPTGGTGRGQKPKPKPKPKPASPQPSALEKRIDILEAKLEKKTADAINLANAVVHFMKVLKSYSAFKKSSGRMEEINEIKELAEKVLR